MVKEKIKPPHLKIKHATPHKNPKNKRQTPKPLNKPHLHKTKIQILKINKPIEITIKMDQIN